MAIVLDMITDAMKDIGALGVGENPTADEAQDALGVLNDMLDMWRTESLLVYSMNENVFTFIAGQATYTIGTGGNFNMPRPDNISAVYLRDVNNNDFPVYVTKDFTVYSDRVSKGVTSQLPTIAYDDGDFPLRGLTFWPAPSDGTYKPVLWTWKVVTEYASTNDNVVLPPGYKTAVQSNLALALCPRYGIKDPSILATIKENAISTKAQIKRANTVPPRLGFPSDIMPGGRWFNYLTGQTT